MVADQRPQPCPTCGYDRRTLDAATPCPECGQSPQALLGPWPEAELGPAIVQLAESVNILAWTPVVCLAVLAPSLAFTAAVGVPPLLLLALMVVLSGSIAVLSASLSFVSATWKLTGGRSGFWPTIVVLTVVGGWLAALLPGIGTGLGALAAALVAAELAAAVLWHAWRVSRVVQLTAAAGVAATGLGVAVVISVGLGASMALVVGARSDRPVWSSLAPMLLSFEVGVLLPMTTTALFLLRRWTRTAELAVGCMGPPVVLDSPQP